jgi:2-polyprenyl-6-methoxyphenol hydroxylase-like FAD-dependent oxidoreductase
LLNAPAGFPLRLMRAPRMVAPRLALVGDAAHTIHPLSGHGINLGFQDARVLAEILVTLPRQADCGDIRWLRRYERSRKEEVVALQSVTDGLQKLFAQPSLPLSLLRNAGLDLTNRLPIVRDLLVRYAMG